MEFIVLRVFWPVHALITHRWSQKLSCHNWLRLQNFQFTELCLVFCISELEDNLQSPYDWISASATKMCTKLHYRVFWIYKIVKTQRNSTQLNSTKATQKQLRWVRHSTHLEPTPPTPPTHPQKLNISPQEHQINIY